MAARERNTPATSLEGMCDLQERKYKQAERRKFG